MLTFILYGILISALVILPISHKWELRKKIIYPYFVIIGVLSGILSYSLFLLFDLSSFLTIIFEIIIIIIISALLLLWRFYRDPDRKIIPNEKQIVAPADGKIIYIQKIAEGQIPISTKKRRHYSLLDLTHTNLLSSAAYHIGIEMTYLDVHVNRAPIEGEISYLNHIKGKFRSLKHREAIFENERNIMIIEGKKISVGIVQIASRLVRMIVPYVKRNDIVRQGDKIGKIRFGSQADIIFPNIKGLKILVSENQYVRAGLDTLAEIELETPSNN
jgi:phosphatidylserine decarboxylase